MGTTKQFVEAHGVKMSAEMWDHNPHMVADDWSKTATHWRCVLSAHGKRMTVYFSQGSAITREPTATDVLDCLASDAAIAENCTTFEEFAAEMGYDEDSRKAEKGYREIRKQAKRLAMFLGAAFDELVWNTERE